MKLYIEANKTPTCWVFDHEHQNTVNEALCNGTEKVIDWYYQVTQQKTPIVGDKIGFHLSTEKLESAITQINLKETFETGSYYIDQLSGMEVWLCPWLQGYFGEVPERIYIQCFSVPKEMSDEEFDQYWNELNYIL